MKRFAYLTPNTVGDAAGAATTTAAAMAGKVSEPSLFKAGGIDLLDLMKENLVAPRRIIDLHHLPGLDQIAETEDGGLRMGAMMTLASLAQARLLRSRYPALAATIEGLGSPQLRNVATLGGNLLQRPHCWYFRSADFACRRKEGHDCFALTGENQYHAVFDNTLCAMVHPSTAATLLVALDAQVELVNAQGQQRRLTLEAFFLRPSHDVTRENDLHPGEILTAIRLPPLAASARAIHLKQGQKAAFDWPLADVAVVLDRGLDGRCRRAAIVLGAAAPVPQRARAAEALLVGHAIDEAIATAASQASLTGATPLEKNGYKLPILATLVRRAILECRQSLRRA